MPNASPLSVMCGCRQLLHLLLFFYVCMGGGASHGSLCFLIQKGQSFFSVTGETFFAVCYQIVFSVSGSHHSVIMNVVNLYCMYWLRGYFFNDSFSLPCFVYFYTVSENLSTFDKFTYFVLCRFLFKCFVYNTCTDVVNEFVHTFYLLSYYTVIFVAILLLFLFSLEHDCKTLWISMSL